MKSAIEDLALHSLLCNLEEEKSVGEADLAFTIMHFHNRAKLLWLPSQIEEARKELTYGWGQSLAGPNHRDGSPIIVGGCLSGGDRQSRVVDCGKVMKGQNV